MTEQQQEPMVTEIPEELKIVHHDTLVEAMLHATYEVDSLVKSKRSFHGYKYTPIEDVYEAVRKITAKHGIEHWKSEKSLELTDMYLETKSGGKQRIIKVEYEYGFLHYKDNFRVPPVEERRVMTILAPYTGTQWAGAILSYFMKYMLREVFLIVTDDDDVIDAGKVDRAETRQVTASRVDTDDKRDRKPAKQNKRQVKAAPVKGPPIPKTLSAANLPEHRDMFRLSRSKGGVAEIELNPIYGAWNTRFSKDPLWTKHKVDSWVKVMIEIQKSPKLANDIKLAVMKTESATKMMEVIDADDATAIRESTVDAETGEVGEGALDQTPSVNAEDETQVSPDEIGAGSA